MRTNNTLLAIIALLAISVAAPNVASAADLTKSATKAAAQATAPAAKAAAPVPTSELINEFGKILTSEPITEETTRDYGAYGSDIMITP